MKRKIWELLAALGERTRLEIVREIACGRKSEGESVGDLSRKLGVEMVNLSHHLGVLRSAGLLENSRHGRHVYYSLSSCWEIKDDWLTLGITGFQLQLFLWHVEEKGG